MEIIDLKTGVSTGALLFLLLITAIQIAPIRINPWDKIFKWLGCHLNEGIIKRVEDIEEKLDGHIKASSDERIRKIRADILYFGNECMGGTQHTKEQYEFVISECDQYESHMESTGTPNGVAKASIKEIRRLYAKNLRENTFLIEGGDLSIEKNISHLGNGSIKESKEKGVQYE